MFCFQCEQTSRGVGCADFGVCGKDESTAILQDLLVHAAKGIAQFNHRARALGARDATTDRFLLEALFATVTNVNFDDDALRKMIRQAIALRSRAQALYINTARATDALLKQGEAVSA